MEGGPKTSGPRGVRTSPGGHRTVWLTAPRALLGHPSATVGRGVAGRAPAVPGSRPKAGVHQRVLTQKPGYFLWRGLGTCGLRGGWVPQAHS